MEALTVSQVNSYLKTLLDSDEVLKNLCVSGEISNYKKYPSGHHYFSLKDAGGVLRSVMFKREASQLGFQPADGMTVVAFGYVSLFPRDGQVQLYCQRLLPAGEGALTQAFNELKKRLEDEGLFDERHKKPLPAFPRRIVLITSPAGAAVRDMIRILGRRWPLAEVLVAPVRVQGSEAPGEIAALLRYANRHALGDLIITGRGGGSLEDLWAFNDERVARAIFASVIPVISAVGHEPDVTIADFVADVRASTPSHAAELAVPDCQEWTQQLRRQRSRLGAALRLRSQRARLRFAPVHERLHRPELLLAGRHMAVDTMTESLRRLYTEAMQQRSALLARQAAQLDALSPLKVLSRGYCVAQDEQSAAVGSARRLQSGQLLRLRFHDGQVSARVEDVKP